MIRPGERVQPLHFPKRFYTTGVSTYNHASLKPIVTPLPRGVKSVEQSEALNRLMRATERGRAGFSDEQAMAGLETTLRSGLKLSKGSDYFKTMRKTLKKEKEKPDLSEKEREEIDKKLEKLTKLEKEMKTKGLSPSGTLGGIREISDTPYAQNKESNIFSSSPYSQLFLRNRLATIAQQNPFFRDAETSRLMKEFQEFHEFVDPIKAKQKQEKEEEKVRQRRQASLINEVNWSGGQPLNSQIVTSQDPNSIRYGDYTGFSVEPASKKLIRLDLEDGEKKGLIDKLANSVKSAIDTVTTNFGFKHADPYPVIPRNQSTQSSTSSTKYVVPPQLPTIPVVPMETQSPQAVKIKKEKEEEFQQPVAVKKEKQLPEIPTTKTIDVSMKKEKKSKRRKKQRILPDFIYRIPYDDTETLSNEGLHLNYETNKLGFNILTTKLSKTAKEILQRLIRDNIIVVTDLEDDLISQLNPATSTSQISMPSVPQPPPPTTASTASTRGLTDISKYQKGIHTSDLETRKVVSKNELQYIVTHPAQFEKWIVKKANETLNRLEQVNYSLVIFIPNFASDSDGQPISSKK